MGSVVTLVHLSTEFEKIGWAVLRDPDNKQTNKQTNEQTSYS